MYLIMYKTLFLYKYFGYKELKYECNSGYFKYKTNLNVSMYFLKKQQQSNKCNICYLWYLVFFSTQLYYVPLIKWREVSLWRITAGNA